eukprot:3839417-Rhodomonas_salina.3
MDIHRRHGCMGARARCVHTQSMWRKDARVTSDVHTRGRAGCRKQTRASSRSTCRPTPRPRSCAPASYTPSTTARTWTQTYWKLPSPRSPDEEGREEEEGRCRILMNGTSTPGCRQQARL